MQLEGVVDFIQYPRQFTKPMEWAVLHLKTPQGKVKATGNIVPCKRGEVFLFDGEFADTKYGKTFNFKESHRSDQGETGAKAYLASLFGPKTAEKIVKHYGDAEEALEIFKRQPMLLIDVKGISAKTVKKAELKHAHYQVVEVLFSTLRPYGISMHTALKLYKKYGANTMTVLENNPYQLMYDFEAIGFDTCDHIATYFNVPATSENRIEAGLIHCMKRSVTSGHSFLPARQLKMQALHLLNSATRVPDNYITQKMSQMIQDEKLVLETGDRVYLPAYHMYEKSTAKNLLRLRGVKNVGNIQTFERTVTGHIDDFERKEGITLHVRQREAILKAMLNSFSVITGPPGSGKTTIINAIIYVMNQMRRPFPNIGMAAPTGKAARRMSETTGLPAFTLQKLLKYRPNDHGHWEFQHNAQNPLPNDLLIADEGSMIDLPMAHHYLSAINKGATVILVGDMDQLQSVGAGRVLADILESAKLPVTRLDEVYRQKVKPGQKQPTVLPRAMALRRGQMPDLSNAHDFTFFEHDDMMTLQEEIVARFFENIRIYGEDEVAILSPMKKGELGVEELNRIIQMDINPPATGKKEVKFGRIIYREGDKVIQTVPNEEHGVVNGQIGYIKSYIPEDSTLGEEERLVVDYEGEEKEYTRDRFDELAHGWVLTVHKSQGSEWKVVLMPIHSEHEFMHEKSLLYTGWTRYKTHLYLFGEKEAVKTAILNPERKRNSMLKERIQGLVA